MRFGTAVTAFRWVLFIFLFAVVITVVWFGLSQIHTLTAPIQKAAGTPSTATALTVEELKTRLDDLKWLLTLLIGAAGLFVIMQAAAAFFNAQSFTKQSEEAIKRLNDMAADVQARFPLFTAIEVARRESYRDLPPSLGEEGFDWRDRVYEQMSPYERQRLLSVERFISIEFLPHPEGSEEYARKLRHLAGFYASKFRYERARNAPYLADLEHAEYYLMLACEATNEAFYFLNDLGVLYLSFHHPPDLGKARTQFDKSLQKQPRQQRAHYNLGVAAAEEENWPAAIEHAENGLNVRPPIWESREVPEQQANLFYNLACYRARYSREPGINAPEQVNKCLEALARAAGLGLIRPETVDYDWDNPNGDMFVLISGPDARTAAKLRALRSQLSANRGVPPRARASWKQRIASAVSVLSGRSY